jgi:hypothetical protein
MANRPIRFGQAQGLEIAGDLYSEGHARLENAELDIENVIRKRDGGDAVPLTRDGGEDLEGAVEIFYRGRELALADGERLYAMRTCAMEPAATVGSFAERGAWSRGTLSESVGAQETISLVTVAAAVRLEQPHLDPDEPPCALEAWSTNALGLGVRARNLGAGLEDSFNVDLSGRDVKGGMIGVDPTEARGMLTWQTSSPADTIRYAGWDPGQQALLPLSSALANVMVGDAVKRWDFAAAADLSGGFCVWCAITTTTNLAIRGRRTSDQFGAPGLTGTLNVNLGAASTARRAAAISIAPTPVTPNVYRITVGAAMLVGGVEVYQVVAVHYDIAANTLTVVAGPQQNTTALAGGQITGLAVAQSPVNPTSEVHVLLETSVPAVEVRALTFGGGDSRLRTNHRLGLVTQFRSVPSTLRLHRNLVVLAELSDGLLANGYFLCEPFRPPGAFSGALPYEVLGRAWVGQARISRGAVEGVNSLVGVGDTLIWAAEGRTDPGETAVRQVVQARWELQRTPMPPAVIDGYVIQAMGGFARFYDGAVTAEQCWHTLPVIVVTGQAGGSLTAGARYTAAVQLFWTDATGREHRSAFTVVSVVLAAGQGTVRVVVNTVQITERFGLKALVFLSDANLSVLYRQNAVAIGADQTTAATVTVNMTTVDTSTEQLLADQLGGDQASITGFCAVAGGRLWGPSSKRGNVIQFSTFAVEGFVPRWDVDALVELPEVATSIRELEGRIVALGRTRITALLGDGPDNAGNGEDYATKDVPTGLGARGHAATVPCSLGLVFDTGAGVHLLDRGFVVQHVGAPVAREYEVEGEYVRSAAFDADRGLVVLLGEQRRECLVFAADTLRWGRELRGDGVVCVAVDSLGHAAWLRQFDVLVERRLETYSPILSWLYASGGIVPAHLYAPRRMADFITGDALTIETTPQIQALVGAPGILGNRMLTTANLNGEALRATSTSIGSIAGQSLAGAAFVRLTSTAAGSVVGKQNGLLEGWCVLHENSPLYRLNLSNSAGVFANADLTALSSAIDVWRVLVWVIDLASGNIRIASDLENGSVAAIPGGLIEAAAIPLRIGDARLPASTVRSLNGDTGGVVLWRPAAPAALDVFALAQQLKLAWDAATGIPATRDAVDGEAAVPLTWSTGWLRVPSESGVSHVGMTAQQAHLAGEYEGDHELVFRVYRDYAASPSKVLRVSELRVAQNRYAGRQYLYRVPLGALGTSRAVLVEVEDGGREVASYRTSRMDLQFDPMGEEHHEVDAELTAIEDP